MPFVQLERERVRPVTQTPVQPSVADGALPLDRTAGIRQAVREREQHDLRRALVVRGRPRQENARD